ETLSAAQAYALVFLLRKLAQSEQVPAAVREALSRTLEDIKQVQGKLQAARKPLELDVVRSVFEERGKVARVDVSKAPVAKMGGARSPAAIGALESPDISSLVSAPAV